ncbi:MAG: hypothetical protein HYV27_02880 [Candidatus Hydrogenedentes bacterium]|nr:hypothetical protein [Candidatus Hydrogenedentota bacterium]
MINDGLFGGDYLPVTAHIGFLKTSLASASTAHMDWMENLHRDLSKTHVTDELRSLLVQLEPLTNRPTKYLWLETRTGWSALLVNRFRVGDVRSTISTLAQRLRCEGLIVDCQPEPFGEPMPEGHAWSNYSFSLLKPTSDGLNRRIIQCANDGGKWTFGQNGIPEPFEDMAAYKSRRIKDRFTARLLRRYCEALGIDIFQETFYGPGGYLYEDREPGQHEFVGLSEARRELGIS